MPSSSLSEIPSFTDLGVAPQFAEALGRQGILEPFAIQIATIPDAIARRDVLARAQTGSGKTLAFGLAALTRLLGTTARPRQPLSLILVPTRELAMQVSDTLRPIAEAAGLRQRLIAGGMPYNKQLEALDRGVHMLIATPGRLMDLAERGSVDLSCVEITVLDEADQMSDMGFMPIVREILDLTKPGSQRLLFSATLDGDVDVIRKAYMSNPVTHSLAPASASVETMDHHVMLVHPMDKELIAAQIGAREGRTIFFVRTQAGVDRLAAHMTSQGIATGALHGGKTQAVRTRTLEAFRNGVTPALVATDVAARGIHVDGISLVVHVDAPRDPKDYLHRAGRTARAGESGTVVTLAAPKQQRTISSLTSRAGVDPVVKRVRPLDAHLVEVTGAREPSGTPWFPPREAPARSKSGSRWGNQGGRSDRPRYGDKPRYSDKPSYSDKPRYEDRAPRTDRYRDDRPKQAAAPRTDRYRDDRPVRDDRAPRTDRYRDDRPKQAAAPRTDRYRDDRPKQTEAPRSDRRADKPRHSSRPTASAGRPHKSSAPGKRGTAPTAHRKTR